MKVLIILAILLLVYGIFIQKDDDGDDDYHVGDNDCGKDNYYIHVGC